MERRGGAGGRFDNRTLSVEPISSGVPAGLGLEAAALAEGLPTILRLGLGATTTESCVSGMPTLRCHELALVSF